jgi:hypothetical protein
MTSSRSAIFAVALATAAGTTLPVSAAIRPWEPSDYVTNGLVLHYDGIRNAGPAAPHDTAATTWVDLSGYGRDAMLTAGAGSAWREDGTGFHFAKTAWFATSAEFSLGTTYTIEVLSNFTGSDNSANAMLVSPSNGIKGGGIWWKNGDQNLFFRGDNAFGTAWNNCAGVRPAGSSYTATYLTALRDGSRTALITGTELPTGENLKGPANATTNSWCVTSVNNAVNACPYLVGASSASGDEKLTGDIRSVRFYTKLLSNTELAWNRAVDEARFFGASSVIAAEPVPGAVPDAFIASAVTGATGAEPCGAYVVDDGGYTFRAAPYASVAGVGYVCTGYTLAAWNGSAYGTAVAHNGEFSCPVSAGDKVRITWQWTAASGSLGSDVAGYVTDNLVFNFDGIRNVGSDRPHDSTATSWANLADRSLDVALWHKTADNCATGFGEGDFAGEWAKDGFVFRGTNFFRRSGAWTMPADATLQLVADIKPGEQESNIPFIVGETDSTKRSGSLTVNKGAGRLDFYCDGQLGCNYDSRPRLTTPPFTYATAVITGNKAAIFTGTAIPDDSNTAANNGGWFVQSDDSKVKGDFSNDRFGIGGGVNWSGTYLVGTVKAIRLYRGVLTDDQLARNRALDEARFFGNGAPASNAVVVCSAIAGLEGREPSGVYFPDNWTFAAGAGTQTSRGIEWECAGYQLQTWDADTGTWGAQQTIQRNGGNAVDYTSPAAPFPSVRLTWLWRPVSGVRTAADYALADYATGALELHMDGKEHGDSATVWSDLSGHGRDATQHIYSGGTGNEWRADGFYFNASADFGTTAKIALGKRTTVQILADASVSQPKNLATLVGADSATSGTILYKSANNFLLYQMDKLTWSGDSNAWQSRSTIESPASIGYLTAVRDGSRTALFTGTEFPSNVANDRHGQALRGWAYGPTDLTLPAMQYSVGGLRDNGTTPNANYALQGTVKSVRVYDRLLTEDELAWNRSVDNARFFGVLTTTNVVVVANEFSGDLADAYEVFGSHTFTASPSIQSGAAADHVRVRHLQADGTWGAAYIVRAPCYTYTQGDGTIQIEFRKAKAFMLIVK